MNKISIQWKAPLDLTIEMSTPHLWKWYFYGITIGQTGFGIIRRVKQDIPRAKPNPPIIHEDDMDEYWDE